MFNTLQHLHALTRAYEQGHITEKELIKEWADTLEMLRRSLLEVIGYFFPDQEEGRNGHE